MKTKIITILLILIVHCTFFNEKCDAQWVKTNGPAGGAGPYSFVVIGTDLFAGTTSGLYRSTDNGLTWTVTTLNSGSIKGLAYSGSNIYAGTTAGMKISTDNGITWSATSLTYSINAVVANGQYVFAGSSGLWRSTDYGQTWNRLMSVPYQTIYSLAIDGPLIYAGTSSYGVYRSTDNGDNWVQKIFNNEPIHALAIKGTRVFATCESSFWGINYGIYGSTDYGDTWPIRALTNRDIWSFAVCGDYIFAGDQEDPTGVYRSSDDGITWVQTGLNYVNIYALSFIGSTIFAGTSNELFISTDYGQTWQYNIGILNNSLVYSLVASGTNIFAGTTSFLYNTSDNGQNWICGLSQQARALIVNNSTIFAGTISKGVYYSFDNGQTWTQSSLNNKTVYSLAVSGDNIFAGTSGYGVYISADDGQTWTQTSLNNKTIYSIAISGDNIFAGDYGVYRSNDNGQTWTLTSLNNRTINSLAVSGSNILAGTTSYGVYLSTDNGQTWTQSSLNNRTINSFAVCNNYVLAGTTSYGVYLSPDNGQTWVTAGMDATTIYSILINDNNIFVGTSGKAVWKFPITPQYITDNIGILKGDILDLLNSNIISQDNYEMLVSKLKNAIKQIEQEHYKISINSIEQFIFEVNLLEEKNILSPEQAQPLLSQAYIIIYMLNVLSGPENYSLKITSEPEKTYILNQNYPNPFNPVTTIKFNISKESDVKLSIYDVSGRMIKSIVNTRLTAGSYEYMFNGANLASGVYFYRLETENFTDVKKMILLK